MYLSSMAIHLFLYWGGGPGSLDAPFLFCFWYYLVTFFGFRLFVLLGFFASVFFFVSLLFASLLFRLSVLFAFLLSVIFSFLFVCLFAFSFLCLSFFLVLFCFFASLLLITFFFYSAFQFCAAWSQNAVAKRRRKGRAQGIENSFNRDVLNLAWFSSLGVCKSGGMGCERGPVGHPIAIG